MNGMNRLDGLYFNKEAIVDQQIGKLFLSDPQGQLDAIQPRYGAQYRAVSWVAVASVVCGLLSFVTVFGAYFIVVPAAGIALGWNAWQRIREVPGELTGRGLAWAGMALSVVLGALGGGALWAYEMREVPWGYTKVDWDDLQPDRDDPSELIPPDAMELDGKRIFIKGYMYPGRQTIGIKRFVLVPTVGHCSFCSPQIKSTEMIVADLQGDLRTTYKRRVTSIGGTLRIDQLEVAKPFGGFPYVLEVDYVR